VQKSGTEQQEEIFMLMKTLLETSSLENQYVWVIISRPRSGKVSEFKRS
jgi:hypothetical protein